MQHAVVTADVNDRLAFGVQILEVEIRWGDWITIGATRITHIHRARADQVAEHILTLSVERFMLALAPQEVDQVRTVVNRCTFGDGQRAALRQVRATVIEVGLRRCIEASPRERHAGICYGRVNHTRIGVGAYAAVKQRPS